jgi:flagellar hook-associated protein 2
MQVNGVSIGSNIDTSVIIEAYKSSFTSSYIKPLQNQQTVLTNQNTVINEIITRMASLRSKLLGLQTGSAFLSKSAASSDESIFTVAADETAASGSYDLNVIQLAQKHKVASSQRSAAGTEIITAEGAGTKQFRMTINGTSTDISVDLVAGDSNQTVLNKIATAINSSGAAAYASVINETGSSSRLVITGNNTGASNAITIADLAGSLMQNAQVINGSGGFINQLQAAQDALFNVDTLSFQRSSNNISDALAGVTFQLKKVGSAELKVGGDTAGVVKTIQDFIDQYNLVVNYTKEATSYDSETKQAGVLLNNPAARNLPFELRPLATSAVSGLTGTLTSLGSIGIEANKDGVLSITDQNKLESAIENNLSSVKSIFGDPIDGVATRMRSYINNATSADGPLYNSQSSISSSIQRLTDQISAKERQLVTYSSMLTAKFSLLDALLSKNSSILSSLSGFSLIPTTA